MTSLMEARAVAAALDAAEDQGVLQALAEAPGDAEAVAGRLGLDALACERVLELLRVSGFVERKDGAYRVGEALRRELMGPSLDGSERRRFWSHTTEFLGKGTPVRPMGDPEDRARAYARATPDLGRMFAAPAAGLAHTVTERVDRQKSIRVLDVGAGSGVWSLALLERLPNARAWALDLPGVLPRFLERAEALGLGDRVEAFPGDYHRTPTEGPWDVVLLANVLHLEPEPEAARLVARWGEAVAEDGSLLVVDMLSEGGVEPAHAAYALHLALRVPGGYPHLKPTISRWVQASGFPLVESIPLQDAPPLLGALLARRAAAYGSES